MRPQPKEFESLPIRCWLADSLEAGERTALRRIAMMEDVVSVAVMPDVHLAGDWCVGTAVATRRRIYPQAVGGDIGCGMLAMAMDVEANSIDAAAAGVILRKLSERIPQSIRSHHHALPLPNELAALPLSCPTLTRFARGDAARQMGTLGGGNHFIELQADADGRLWLMLHSGSRAIGQAVYRHHRSLMRSRDGIDADSADGQGYVHDVRWACRFARANRAHMAAIVCDVLREVLRASPQNATPIDTDHNHLLLETFAGEPVWVHRKGAMNAERGLLGVVPGSMGTRSYHVRGKGETAALRSSAHGAGRRMSRAAARQKIGRFDLRHQMRNVWYDPRRADSLREEAPHAYKDVRAVMSAQADLVEVVRELKPILVFKGS
jgi:tRNA-splicing ligase RtcB (3'-phosphate/5'-hydroxy nucleic acid ligase)